MRKHMRQTYENQYVLFTSETRDIVGTNKHEENGNEKQVKQNPRQECETS